MTHVLDTRGTTRRSAYATLGSLRKAKTLVRHIWTEFGKSGDRRNPEAVELLERTPNATRHAIAQDAGVEPPSFETWALVVEEIRWLHERAVEDVR